MTEPPLSKDNPAFRGQAVYTPGFLRFYDTLVLRFNGTFLWRCPPRRLVQHYNENISPVHLDIGVGTGYLLDRCTFPTPSPEITLMDLNPNPLVTARDRLRRYHPRSIQGNALEAFELPSRTFQSVGLNWLLHCLPGDMAAKSVVFDNCQTVLAPGGVIFGSTVVNGGVRHTRRSNWMMRKLNRDGVFNNLEDDLVGLERELRARFVQPEVTVVGTVAMFVGRV